MMCRRGYFLVPDYSEFFDLQGAGTETRQAVRRDFIAAAGADLERLGLDRPQAAPIAKRLWTDMAAPKRHYHSAIHVLGIFAEAAKLHLRLSDAERLAIWFHDSIFDPTAPPGRNEELSAAYLMQTFAGMPIQPDLLHRVAEAIRSTACHTRNDIPSEHHLVMDLDLAGFAAPPPVFARQSAALRLEYDHLDDAAYTRGTIDFLRQILSRRSMYYTPHFAPREAVARRQLEGEIERLSQQLVPPGAKRGAT